MNEAQHKLHELVDKFERTSKISLNFFRKTGTYKIRTTGYEHQDHRDLMDAIMQIPGLKWDFKFEHDLSENGDVCYSTTTWVKVIPDTRIDWDTVEIDGVDGGDYPKFVDAYFSYGRYMDGTEIPETRLDSMANEYYETLHEMATESFL